MATRLKDIAKHLNLSPALVSGILNGKENVWASEETRRRVHEAAATMNYQPSAAARALSRGRTTTVAFVYRRLSSLDYRLAYTGLVDAFSADLQAHGYDLMVSNFGTQDEVLDHLSKLASSRACAAVVLWGREQDTEPQGELLESLGLPFLVKGRHEETHPGWVQVDFDHEGMMRAAFEHLWKLGHRRFAYLGFPHEDAFVQALRRGFADAHRQHLGYEPSPDLIGEHFDEVDGNEETINRWLAKPESERPTAFVIGAGNAAWRALETCLAKSGHRLGFGPNDYAASGIASLFFTLMFGEALVYQGIEIDNLAHFAAPHLIDGLLKGVATNPIERFLPALSQSPTLDLLRHGVLFNAVADSSVADSAVRSEPQRTENPS